MKFKSNILKAFALAFIFLNVTCKGTEEDPIEINEGIDSGINYLALGDSYTIGEGIDRNLRWPRQLRDTLSELSFDIQSTQIIAQTGWTTRDLIFAIDNQTIQETNLVSLQIGVNNQFRGLPFSTFEAEFDELLAIAVELAGSKNRVFVLSIPDYGVTPFGANNSEEISQEINRYNGYILRKCEEEEISYTNITDISRQLGDSEGALADDDLHPSGMQYALWVDRVLPSVIQIINP